MRRSLLLIGVVLLSWHLAAAGPETPRIRIQGSQGEAMFYEKTGPNAFQVYDAEGTLIFSWPKQPCPAWYYGTMESFAWKHFPLANLVSIKMFVRTSSLQELYMLEMLMHDGKKIVEDFATEDAVKSRYQELTTLHQQWQACQEKGRQ
jgi:hypothetical protein